MDMKKKVREICGCHGVCAKSILNEEKFFCIEDMGIGQKSCVCEKPILQSQTKQCGRCGSYIDRVSHVMLTRLRHEEDIEQQKKRRRTATILAIILVTLILLLA